MAEASRLREERVARNQAIFRDANARIREAAEEIAVESAPFLCECSDPTCRELLRLTLDQYAEVRRNDRRFFGVLDHLAGDPFEVVVEHGDGYVIVEKRGEAGEIAESLADGREPA